MRGKTSIVLGLLLVLGMAGCGDPPGDGIATAGGTPSAAGSARPGAGDAAEMALKHAECMRTNGVPEFPDPKIDGERIELNLPMGVDKARLKAAEEKCRQYALEGGQPRKLDPDMQAKLLKFAECMRANGVPKFPDPVDGGIQIDGDKVGMGPDDARMKVAERVCNKLLPPPPSGEPSARSETRSG